ncbi:MAG: prolyl oligopeptidase family protein [Candidatus Neomarinimicrobiota bacterium]
MVSLFFSCSGKKLELNYIETREGDHVDSYFGVEVRDPYRWLEDDMSEETNQWVEDQNHTTFEYLNTIPFRENLKKRIKELNNYEKISAPFKKGKYEYFYKNSGLQDHSILYRRLAGSTENEEIFLDPNTFSKDGTVALRGIYFSEDYSKAAYLITEGGSDWRKAITIDVKTKQIIEDTLKNIKFSGLSWKGNEGVYYSSYKVSTDESALSSKTQLHTVYYHKVGEKQIKDKFIFGGNKHPNRYIFSFVTEDQNYLVISASTTTSGNKLFVKSLKEKNSEFISIQNDYLSECSYILNDGNQFYLSTNKDAPNFRLISLDLSNPKKWVDIIPEKDNVLNVSAGGGYLFCNYLVDAKSQVEQYDLKGNLVYKVPLPGIGSAGGFSAKSDETELYFSFSSYIYPRTIYKYNIENGQSILYEKPKVDFNSEDFISKQIFFQSKDGTTIPMFITHKRGIINNGDNPTILYGYGGFNISITPRFSSTNIAWLKNGGIYAVPNIRGGGEYGENWHLAGTKLNKQNVFDDFISAAEYLIENKYTSKQFLAIRGVSNGGLLVGATMIQRSDLIKVAIPAVGVLDMLRYHQFTAGAGWSYDYGTADESKEMFEYLKKYSPVHTIKEGIEYPATLVTTSDHDDRVVPAHSYKFIAGIQKVQEGLNPTLIRIQTNAGHGSVSLDQRIELETDILAFIWKNMKVTPKI